MPFGELRGRPLLTAAAVAFLVICGVMGGVVGMTQVKKEYESEAVVLVLPPGAGNKDARMNPFINLDNNMVQLAFAMTTALNSGQTAVDLAPIDPSISEAEAETVTTTEATASAGGTVQVRLVTKAENPDAAVAMTKRLIDYSRTVLQRMQEQAGVRGQVFADIVVVVPATPPQEASASALRSIVSSAMLGIILASAVLAAVLGVLRFRRRRPSARGATGDGEPVRDPDAPNSDASEQDLPSSAPSEDVSTPTAESANGFRQTAGAAFREQRQNGAEPHRVADDTPAVRRSVIKRSDLTPARPTAPGSDGYQRATLWYESDDPTPFADPVASTVRFHAAPSSEFTEDEIAGADAEYRATATEYPAIEADEVASTEDDRAEDDRAEDDRAEDDADADAAAELNEDEAEAAVEAEVDVDEDDVEATAETDDLEAAEDDATVEGATDDSAAVEDTNTVEDETEDEPATAESDSESDAATDEDTADEAEDANAESEEPAGDPSEAATAPLPLGSPKPTSATPKPGPEQHQRDRRRSSVFTTASVGRR